MRCFFIILLALVCRTTWAADDCAPPRDKTFLCIMGDGDREQKAGRLENALRLYCEGMAEHIRGNNPPEHYYKHIRQILIELDQAERAKAKDPCVPIVVKPTETTQPLQRLTPRPPGLTPPPPVSKDPPKPIQPQPVYKRWWFWTAIGAGVAGAVTTGVVLRQRYGVSDLRTLEFSLAIP